LSVSSWKGHTQQIIGDKVVVSPPSMHDHRVKRRSLNRFLKLVAADQDEFKKQVLVLRSDLDAKAQEQDDYKGLAANIVVGMSARKPHRQRSYAIDDRKVCGQLLDESATHWGVGTLPGCPEPFSAVKSSLADVDLE